MNDHNEQFRREIAKAGFIPPETIRPGVMERFSTNGRRSDKSGWCKLFPEGGGGVFGDFRSGLSNTWFAQQIRPFSLAERQNQDAALRQARVEAAELQARQWVLAAAKNETLWSEAKPVTENDPVMRYLAARGIYMESRPQAVRCHPGLAYWHQGQCVGRFPAMLGAVTDVSGQLVSIHRTYLSEDGQKADVEIVKKLTGSSARLAGCSIKLGEPDLCYGVKTLAVAEGIETALACMTTAIPTVSAVSAQGLSAFHWPGDVMNLIIFADNDMSQVGQRAAAALQRRAKQRGLAAQVFTPPIAGTDWADVLAARSEGC